MTDPPRLAQSGSEACRQLLASGSADDRHHGRAMARTAAALGISAGTALTTSASATAASAAATAVSPATVAWLTVIKWFAVGVASGVVVLAAGKQMSPTQSATSAVAAACVSAPVEKAANAPAVVGQVPAMVASSSADGPVVPPARADRSAAIAGASGAEPLVAAQVSATATSSGRSSPPDIRGDVAMVDRGREALAAGRADEALRHLDQYDQDKKSAVLDPEALLIRIEALRRQGRVQQALALAETFVRTFPTNPHTPRLRTLISGADEKAPEP